jgi:hypothetical protein
MYGCAIVLLLFPLFLLGQPATKSAKSGSSAGGKLSQLRAEYGLSQAELGKIDPASETMKMATLGLRGVATNLLWMQANKYKKTESWDKLSATLNQIAKLQPNYITVWEFQAHNMSYNVSVEFDNYEHRYHWVKRGIDFLIEGTRYNQRNPRLFWNLGWFTGQKFGRSDEYKQFRPMFADDRDFQESMNDYINVDRARGPLGKPDNWLVANLWYLLSHEVVDKGVPTTWLRIDPEERGINDKRRSSVIFYSDPSLALINHADAITEEMVAGEQTREAWKRAGLSWDDFGSMDIATSWGHTVRLDNLENLELAKKRYRGELEELSGGLREKIREERRAKLSDQEAEAFELLKKGVKLSTEMSTIAAQAYGKLTVTDFDVVERLPDDLKVQGRVLAARAEEADTLASRTSSYGDVVNYHYWKRRCEIEQAADTADARRFMMLGDRAAKDGDPDGARENYEKSWVIWAEILKKYPELVDDVMADDLRDVIHRYKLVLDQLDEEFPEEFILKVLVEDEAPPQLPPSQLEDSKAADEKATEKSEDTSPNTSDEDTKEASSEELKKQAEVPSNGKAASGDSKSDDKPASDKKGGEKTGPADKTQSDAKSEKKDSTDDNS